MMKSFITILATMALFASNTAFAQSAGSVAAPGSPSSSGSPGAAPGPAGTEDLSATNGQASGAIIDHTQKKKAKKGGKIRKDTSPTGSNMGSGSTGGTGQ